MRMCRIPTLSRAVCFSRLYDSSGSRTLILHVPKQAFLFDTNPLPSCLSPSHCSSYPSVLELPGCEEEQDMHGSMVFRGPKVKMGIYGGVPTRVLPHNTTGRADYFGPLVNRSARLCHAAARGGQVRTLVLVS